MCRAGDMQRAWAIYEKTDLAFHELSAFTQSTLLDEPQHATVLHSDVSGALLLKYDSESSKIEEACAAK